MTAPGSRWRRELLPHMVDRLAREEPDALYGIWPVDPTSYAAGLQPINFAQLANVVNGLAAWIVEHVGPAKGTVEALAYIGPNDVRNNALALAAVKAGYVIFFDSPRNSPQAHRALFKALDCKHLLTTDPTPPPARIALQAVEGQAKQLTIPSVQELLGKTHPEFVFEKTWEEGRYDPLLALHTSGTTGLPKPLIWTAETIARQHNGFALGVEPPAGTRSIHQVLAGKRTLTTLPPFHLAGLAHNLCYGIGYRNVMNTPAATAMVTADGLVEALKQTPSDVAVVVPSVVADLAQNPAALEYVANNLEQILYMGGDLPQALGDIVAAKVRLQCLWGATEVGFSTQLIPHALSGSHDWHYTSFHPQTGVVFEPVRDGLSEMVFRRHKDETDRKADSCLFPVAIKGSEVLDEYRTKDLFVPHETVPNCWRWCARLDDIIVFLNGEKTNPISMEHHVTAKNPELNGVLVIGAQRFQPAMIIDPKEPATTTAEQAALIERVWPSIDEANKEAPAHARVEKSFVLVTAPDRPLVRAGKGTLIRSTSIAQYEAEIEKLYANAEVVLEDEDSPHINVSDAEAVSRFIHETIRNITGNDPGADNLFEQGMDSLQALQLTRALRRGLHRPDLNMPTIYQHPTVAGLTLAVMDQGFKSDSDDRRQMEDLLATYKSLIHAIPKPDSTHANGITQSQVVLTGSTGTLGTFLLNSLLGDPNISHIFCLNRAKDGGRETQVSRFASIGLSPDNLSKRVTFLQADLSQPSLGLDREVYETIRTGISHIIHNAWPVNFNLSLPAFRPQLAGVLNLFSLAASAAPGAIRVTFTSSVGAVSNAPSKPAPEALLESLDSPAPNGYSRSKFLAEHLCDAAARHLGTQVTVTRLGQIAGAVNASGNGATWNKHEWFPSLVVSSAYLGCIPDGLGPALSTVDWVPSDVVSEVILDLSSAAKDGTATEGAEIFNVRNPQPVQWAELLPAFQGIMEHFAEKKLEVVPPKAWLAKLKESMVGADMSTAEAVAANPAVKLYDFYEQTLWAEGTQAELFTIDKALAASNTLRKLSPVGKEWVYKWVKEWLAV